MLRMQLKHNRVLVVYKPIHKKESSTHEVLPHWVKHRRSHERTIASVSRELQRFGFSFKLVDRSKFQPPKGIDFIVTVGGDGTVLTAAHMANGIPILGVNSMPRVSVGFFCAVTAATFRPMLTAMLAGKKQPTALPMLQGAIDGEPLTFPALNDILFAASSPADSVYYKIKAGNKHEVQRSSGVWVTAGPGSTAGFKSAGGIPSSIRDNRLRFIVREPCPLPGKSYHWLKYTLPAERPITITNEGREGIVYLDGSAHVTLLKHHQTLTIGIAPTRAQIFLSKKQLER
ncbi:MAG: NAD(+)/NADH kinase [Deltaproteobacteria bacterium]|nr:NAD(+)/NADH kinase [Deltaproteobacteria bacterium]